MFCAPPTPPAWLQDGGIAEIIVEAPRAERVVTTSDSKLTVVTSEQLEATGERSLPRAISMAAGVWVQESNLGGGAPVIRGLLGNQVLILIDGVRLNDSTTRLGPNQSLNTIDPSIVERVEIVRGPASVPYGSDAIGGAILVWTKRAGLAAPGSAAHAHAVLESVLDSATDGGRVSAELGVRDERFGAYVAASGARWNDLETGESGDAGPTGYHTSAGFLSAELGLEPERTLRVTGMVHRDFDVPRTFSVVPGFGQTEAPFERYDFALQEREWTVATFDDRTVGAIADVMQIRLSARRSKEQRVRRRTGSSAESFGETRVDTLGLSADWQKDLENQRITWGFDIDADEVDSFGRSYDVGGGSSSPQAGEFAPNARYTSYGAFIQDELFAFAPFYVTAGLRYSRYDFAFDAETAERVRGDFDAVTASLEASRDLDERTTITATLAQGFQAPNLEDLANDGDFAGGVELANPELDSAKSLSGELALDLRESTWNASTGLFWTRVDDVIGRDLIDAGDPLVSGDETYMRVNDGELELWGAEVRAEHRLGAASSPWSVRGLASFVRGRQRDESLGDVDARRIPPLNGRLSLVWSTRAATSAWLDEAALSAFWADGQDRLHPDDASDPRIDPDGTPGFVVWDLEFAGALRHNVRWGLRFANLLDELYRVHGSGIDGPGRAAILRLQASF